MICSKHRSTTTNVPHQRKNRIGFNVGFEDYSFWRLPCVFWSIARQAKTRELLMYPNRSRRFLQKTKIIPQTLRVGQNATRSHIIDISVLAGNTQGPVNVLGMEHCIRKEQQMWEYSWFIVGVVHTYWKSGHLSFNKQSIHDKEFN